MNGWRARPRGVDHLVGYLPQSFALLLIGLVQSLDTPWGLIRHC